MPATITHSFFSSDVYNLLPRDIRSYIDIDRCRMFAQSTDSLMFYNLFSILPGKKMRKFQYTFHTTKTQEFFINVLRYIKENNIVDIDTYSFLFGFICHYALDSNLHPYIIYKTGIFEKSNPATYKYNNIHALMESFIDMDMVKRRTNKNPYKFDFNSFCFDIRPFSNDLVKTIDYAFFNTYGIKNMSKIYYKSLKQMRNSLIIFRKDAYGIKKFIYKLVDTFTFDRTYRFEAISYHVSLEDKHNYLNSNNSLWRHPVNYDVTSNESFIDLFLKSTKFAKVLMCASYDYLDGKAIDLTKIFTNLSYTTGIDCNENQDIKYFEF